MKANIFLYPTNEPSQLYRIIGSNDLGKTSNDPYYTENMGGGTQNQYVVVISNDPIKVGDWTLMFDSVGNLFLGHEPQQYLGIEHGHHLNDGLRKIVLSNDPKLISTGVQPINEDFLEWLVNNPTCKFVETDSNFNRGNGKTYYKIILPKEYNTVQENSLEKNREFVKNTSPEVLNNLMKEFDNIEVETLEEVAKRESQLGEYDRSFESTREKYFIKGAKWQAERMYSEEDMIKAIKFGELYQKSGQKALFEKKGKTPSQAIEHFIKSFNKK